jgi:hypothetical protein
MKIKRIFYPPNLPLKKREGCASLPEIKIKLILMNNSLNLRPFIPLLFVRRG